MAKPKRPLKSGTVSATLKSPFSSERIEVILKSTTLHVHRALLAGKSQLYYTGPAHDPNSVLSSSGDHVRLDDASLEVGHVLVMWLYTGTYQLLPGLDGAEPPTRDAFKTALGVYTLARQYTLSGLEGLAKDQITLLATELGIYTAIDIIIETFPSQSKHDAWLSEFLSTRMKETLKDDPSSAQLPGPPCQPEAATTITTTIVRSVLDAYREKSEDLMAREEALEEELAAREAALEETLAAREAALEQTLATREAALKEATRALVDQQMTFALDNAIKKTAMVPPPEPPVSEEISAPEPNEGSDCELAPEDVPSAFAAAVIQELAMPRPASASPENAPEDVPSVFAAAVIELAMPRPASASPENDWVVTSPPAAEPEPEVLVVSTKSKKQRCKKCKHSSCPGRKGLKCKYTHEPEEPEIPCEPEAEPEQVEELAEEPDSWGLSFFGATRRGKERHFGAKEEEQKQMSEHEPELEPAPEPEQEPELELPVKKKDKKKKKLAPEPEPEPELEPEPVPEPVPEPELEAPVMKKDKKKKKTIEWL